jgi:hypothetical protein
MAGCPPETGDGRAQRCRARPRVVGRIRWEGCIFDEAVPNDSDELRPKATLPDLDPAAIESLLPLKAINRESSREPIDVARTFRRGPDFAAAAVIEALADGSNDA